MTKVEALKILMSDYKDTRAKKITLKRVMLATKTLELTERETQEILAFLEFGYFILGNTVFKFYTFYNQTAQK